MKTRVWIPSRRYVLNTAIPVSVETWTWTKRYGLRVTYKNGIECKSDYDLPEFLLALKEGREYATEVISSNYQDQLIQRRRAALWRACDRLRAERRAQARQGKREDQVAFSATVVFAVLVLSALLGVGVGAWVAMGGGR